MTDNHKLGRYYENNYITLHKTKRLNRFITILLLLSFHAQPLMTVSVWVDYCINNDYIREVLCINKERPKLQCDGKCYLTQQLSKKSTKKESQEKAMVMEQSLTPVFFVEIQDVIFKNTASLSTAENSNYINHYRLLIDKERDRPPNFS